MPDASDLAAAISELDEGYLQVQLLLAVRRAGAEQPRRAAMWHALARLFAEEQQRRRQSTQLTGESTGAGEVGDEAGSAVEDVREELRRDAEAIDAEYGDAAGEFPVPAGQAPLVQPDEPGGTGPATGQGPLAQPDEPGGNSPVTGQAPLVHPDEPGGTSPATEQP